jgi:hypothetical protein
VSKRVSESESGSRALTLATRQIKELPVAGLFRDLKGTTAWETSGTDVVGDQVFDDLL